MAPDVTVQEVADYAPDAPAVTAAQILEARDWAEPLLEQAGVVLVAGTRAERAARRAVMNYALHLRTFIQATSTRTSASITTGVLKSIDIEGELKVERATVSGDRIASEAATAASSWLALAWSALHDAGVPRPSRRVVGASR
ncbi:hypothetical protein [Deinococcus enclensis]|uniref:DUF4054 domain-containing protein n=1 Tax=Deinococcus enclensis TaxID=1049582 RepID=A0ABT9MB78_9DEIO|nr:hypothetical protein [Deinococcus enclensis]MDP9763845.1 hypothetical protein [Deinococcus enclensis]